MDTPEVDLQTRHIEARIEDCEREIQRWQKLQDQLREELAEVTSLKFIFENGITRSSVFVPSEYRGRGATRRFAEWLREVRPSAPYILRYGAIYALTDDFVVGDVTPINPAHLGIE